jgi:hypothetical protein
MQLPLKQHRLYEESSPSFCAGRKLGDVEQALLWSLLQKDPQGPSRVLLDKATEQHLEIAVSIRHINRWRATQGLNRGKGRPGQADGYQPVSPGAEVVRVTPPDTVCWRACICPLPRAARYLRSGGGPTHAGDRGP